MTVSYISFHRLSLKYHKNKICMITRVSRSLLSLPMTVDVRSLPFIRTIMKRERPDEKKAWNHFYTFLNSYATNLYCLTYTRLSYNLYFPILFIPLLYPFPPGESYVGKGVSLSLDMMKPGGKGYRRGIKRIGKYRL
jgi:hypothetical protein